MTHKEAQAKRKLLSRFGRFSSYFTESKVLTALVAAMLVFTIVIAFFMIKVLDQGNALVDAQNKITDLQKSRHSDALQRDADLRAQLHANKVSIHNAFCFTISLVPKGTKETKPLHKLRVHFHCPPIGTPFKPTVIRKSPGVGFTTPGIPNPSSSANAGPAPATRSPDKTPKPSPRPTPTVTRTIRPTATATKTITSSRTPTPKPSPILSLPVCIKLNGVSVGC